MQKLSYKATLRRKGEDLSAFTLPLFAWVAASSIDIHTEKLPAIRSAAKVADRSADESPPRKTESVSTKPIGSTQSSQQRVSNSALQESRTPDPLFRRQGLQDKHANAINNSHNWKQEPVYPQSLAGRHGAIGTIEPWSRCGITGLAYYAHDGWGFTLRSRCGDPLKCRETSNNMSGYFLLIEGGKA